MTAPVQHPVAVRASPRYLDVADNIEMGNIAYVEEALDSIPFPKDELRNFLSHACQFGDEKMTKLILSYGVAIYPIHASNAFQSKKVDVFQELLNHGWDLESRLLTGATPICDAASNENLLRWFLEHGADPNAQQLQNTPFYGTPSTAAATSRSSSKLEVFLSNGAVPDPVALFIAMTYHPDSGFQLVKILIEYGVDVNGIGIFNFDEGHYDDSPLHCAVGMGRRDYVELLLQSGAKPELERFGKRTPATLAKRLGKMELYDLIKNWDSQSLTCSEHIKGPCRNVSG